MDSVRFDQVGFSTADAAVDAESVRTLGHACDRLSAGGARVRAGLRDLLSRDALLRELASSAPVRAVAEPLVGPSAFVTRSILFDKTPDTNWDVVWHQDITIAVRARVETPGFGPWSVKAGVPHVQPPAHVLEGMVTIRIHLDDCFEDNGPLLVVPGSHRSGILSDQAIDPARCEENKVACCVPAGGAVIMRPLILHASRKAMAPAHRRVIHLEFAARPLPGGLEWARI
jgi:ectoine hydroxylase-related dioxygenase (phytanoyl-CoA dioxygenase family)